MSSCSTLHSAVIVTGATEPDADFHIGPHRSTAWLRQDGLSIDEDYSRQSHAAATVSSDAVTDAPCPGASVIVECILAQGGEQHFHGCE